MSDDGAFQVYDGGFVVLPNETVNDTRLSFRARGLLAYLIGRPPGWRFATERIAKESGGPLAEGRDAVRSAMRELIALGYLRRKTHSAPNGQLLTLTQVAARPDLLPPDEPTAGKPTTAQPSSVKPSPKSGLKVVNTEEVNTEDQDQTHGAPSATVAVRQSEVAVHDDPKARALAVAQRWWEGLGQKPIGRGAWHSLLAVCEAGINGGHSQQAVYDALLAVGAVPSIDRMDRILRDVAPQAGQSKPSTTDQRMADGMKVVRRLREAGL